MDNGIFLALAVSLGLTVTIELAFALCCKIRAPRDILLVVLVNLLTNPAVVLSYLLLRQRVSVSPVFIVLPLELAAVAVEGFCYKYRGEKIKRPFLFSFCANVLSYCLGIVFSFVF
ncbi:MAG: hypothetical protein EOM14_03250 [Clostridia bacterium]|nr:hypothetical protein [Clostridia bacterium]